MTKDTNPRPRRERQSAIAVGRSESVAGKTALQQAGPKLTERLLPKLAEMIVFMRNARLHQLARAVRLLFLVAMAWGVEGQETAPEALTVLNFQNRHPGDGNDWLQKAFPDMLLTHFVQHGKFAVVERERMQQLADELALPDKGVLEAAEVSAFARIAKVTKVVYGHYLVDGGGIQVTAFIFDATSNSVDSVATVSGELQSVCEWEHQLFARLLKHLGAPLTDADRAELACVVSDNLSAASRFYQAMAAFDEGDYPEALVQFQQAARQDARYGEARLWTARMYSFLGEHAHAVVTLRQFVRDLPQHPLLPQVRLRTGLALLQDLQRPRLAAAEFEALVRLSPATGGVPAALREAHWDEYGAVYRGLWDFIWFAPEQHTLDQAEAQKLVGVGKQRAQQLELFVEGWYRLGQSWELAGDLVKAFAAYDQGRAVCRWLLLDQSVFTDRLYGATYDAYHRLLLTDGIVPPTPDWAWELEADQPQTILGPRHDQLYRYALERAYASGPARADFILLAPPGGQFATLTTQADTLDDGPLGSGAAVYVRNFAPSPCLVRSESVTRTNGLTVTTRFPPGSDYRAVQLFVRGLGTNSGNLSTVTVTPSYGPWQGTRHPALVMGAAQAGAWIHRPGENTVLRIDGTPMPPPDAWGYFHTSLSPGHHRFELQGEDGRTTAVVLHFEPGSCHRVFLSLNHPWRDTAVRLPHGCQPDLCRAPDGYYWLAYAATVGAAAGEPETQDDIWLIKTRDFREWTSPMRLPINSPDGDRGPRLMVLPDGQLQLAFISDRRQGGPPGLYLSRTIDGREWSVPRRLADVGSHEVLAERDGTGRYWLLYHASASGQQILLHSADGRDWSLPASVPFESLLEGTPARLTPEIHGMHAMPDGRLVLLGQTTYGRLIQVGRPETESYAFAISTRDGHEWKLEMKPAWRVENWARGAVVGNRELRVLPLPEIYRVNYSRVMRLPDKSCVLAASQPPEAGSGANTIIYTATEDEMRSMATTIPLGTDP